MSDHMKPVNVVLGAGPAGLAAAYHLTQKGQQVLVLEKESRVGGMGATQRVGNYYADYGPHTFHLKDTEITELFERLAGDSIRKVRRNQKLWIQGMALPFPLTLMDALTKLRTTTALQIVIDYIAAQIMGIFRSDEGSDSDSFENWGLRKFGKTLYQLAFGDYSEKVWGIPGSELSEKLAKQKLRDLSLAKLFFNTLGLLNSRRSKALGINRHAVIDGYLQFGIGEFYKRLSTEIESTSGKIILNAEPLNIVVEQGRAKGIEYLDKGVKTFLSTDSIISTIPLPALCELLPTANFCVAKSESKSIRYRSLIVVNLVLNQDSFSNAQWIYLIEPAFHCNRISEQKNLCENACPPGKTLVALEITCDYNDFLWNAEDSLLISLALHDLSLMHLHPRTVSDAFVLKATDAHPVYTKGFEKNLTKVIDNLTDCENLYSIGRHGLLLNNDMHDSMEMGFLCVDKLVSGAKSADWYELMDDYVSARLEGKTNEQH